MLKCELDDAAVRKAKQKRRAPPVASVNQLAWSCDDMLVQPCHPLCAAPRQLLYGFSDDFRCCGPPRQTLCRVYVQVDMVVSDCKRPLDSLQCISAATHSCWRFMATVSIKSCKFLGYISGSCFEKWVAVLMLA